MGYLRSLLAITVLIGHTPLGSVFVGGKLAVQIFYMISGFLIAHAIRSNPAYRDPKVFWINRALRIYPIYFAVALLSLLYIALVDRSVFEVFQSVPASAQTLLALSNLLIFGQDWVMFSGLDQGQLVFTIDFRQSTPQLWNGLVVPQAWTLGVELTFYALAPFMLRRAWVMVLLLLLSCTVRVLTMKLGFGWEDPWTYRFFPSELAVFLVGALSNRWLLPLWQAGVPQLQSTWLPTAATVLLLAVCVFYRAIPMTEFSRMVALLSLCAVLLPLAFVFQQGSRLDPFVGELSYPIYISHMLVVWVMAAVVSTLELKAADGVQAAVAVVLTCLLAHGLNLLIAKPVERVRATIRGRNASPRPAVA